MGSYMKKENKWDKLIRECKEVIRQYQAEKLKYEKELINVQNMDPRNEKPWLREYPTRMIAFYDKYINQEKELIQEYEANKIQKVGMPYPPTSLTHDMNGCVICMNSKHEVWNTLDRIANIFMQMELANEKHSLL